MLPDLQNFCSIASFTSLCVHLNLKALSAHSERTCGSESVLILFTYVCFRQTAAGGICRVAIVPHHPSMLIVSPVTPNLNANASHVCTTVSPAIHSISKAITTIKEVCEQAEMLKSAHHRIAHGF